MSQNFNRGPMTPRPKTILDHPIHKIHGEMNSSGKRPTFHCYLHVNQNDPSKNAPRIVVYTNDDHDKSLKQDQIQGELDLISFIAFTNSIADAANPAIEFKQETVELRNYIWMNGQRSEEPKTKAYLIVGREENGTVYVSLRHFDPKRGAVKFQFGYTQYVRMVRQEGPMPPEFASRRVATAMSEKWKKTMIEVWDKETKLPVAKQQGGFGGQGNGGGFGGGQQQGGFGGQQQGGFQGGFQAGGNKAPGGYNPEEDTLLF